MTDLPKLIRDRIPEIAEENGDELDVREAEKLELKDFLEEKIVEEAEELEESSEVEELADLLEVIDAYREFRDIDENELEELRKEKKEERGGFEKGLILEEIID